jgi:alpha-tubulin suppressor-like RCC1 family protein
MKRTCFLLIILCQASASQSAVARLGAVMQWGMDISASPTTRATNTIYFEGHSITNAIAVSAGTFHALALLGDGTVVGWGANQDGKAVGDSSNDHIEKPQRVLVDGAELRDVVCVCAGNTYSVAAKKDGTVVLWGKPRFSLAPDGNGFGNAHRISAGGNSFLVLNTSQQVVGANLPLGLNRACPKSSRPVRHAVS